jgi:hypothetical protein
MPRLAVRVLDTAHGAFCCLVGSFSSTHPERGPLPPRNFARCKNGGRVNGDSAARAASLDGSVESGLECGPRALVCLAESRETQMDRAVAVVYDPPKGGLPYLAAVFLPGKEEPTDSWRDATPTHRGEPAGVEFINGKKPGVRLGATCTVVG